MDGLIHGLKQRLQAVRVRLRPAADGSGHSRVLASDPYRFEVAHRRLAWMLRLSAATNIGLLVLAVVLVNTVSAMMPLRKTEIALVRSFGPEDRLYRIEPVSEDVDGFELLLESTARRWVRLVLEIDSVTQEERHREASFMTDRRLWRRLRSEHLDTQEVGQALQDGLVRTVIPDTTTHIEGVNNDLKVVVDFTRTDTVGGVVIATRSLRAYLAMETRPTSVRPEDRYANPLGITVTDFVLKERQT